MAASKSEASGGRRKKTGGRPRTAAGRPGVTWLDRLHHAREIVQLKDNEGLTWPQVAERTGRPKTTCERLYRDFKRNGDLHPDRDAWAWVYAAAAGRVERGAGDAGDVQGDGGDRGAL
jgi:hypothetical protein